MKKIISDYIYLRMTFSFAVILIAAAVFFFGGFNWLIFSIALLNIFACFDMAIKISDFEMSDLGETVRLCESKEYSRVDVYFRK